MTLPCTGCKHLVHANSGDLCSALDPGMESFTNPYTGRLEWRFKEGPRAKYWLRPSVVDVRSGGRECGPDRKLYAPSALTLFMNWLSK